MSTSVTTESVRQQMVDQQVRTWAVLDPMVLDAMGQIRRENFVPEIFRKVAFADSNVPLGHGQCMLAPKIDGRILQALAVTKTDDVLDVGTGSGYLAACLGRCAAHVRSIEIFPDLAAQAIANLQAAAINNVVVEVADALTSNTSDLYDAIAVTGSVPTLGPLAQDRFAQALKVGGRLFLTVGQTPIMRALKITRIAQDKWRTEELFETVIPNLVNASRPSGFVF